MDKDVLIILIIIHVVGSILTIIVHYLNGTYEWAARNGDGIRYNTPAGIIFEDLFIWEANFLVSMLFHIEDWINGLF